MSNAKAIFSEYVSTLSVSPVNLKYKFDHNNIECSVDYFQGSLLDRLKACLRLSKLNISSRWIYLSKCQYEVEYLNQDHFDSRYFSSLFYLLSKNLSPKYKINKIYIEFPLEWFLNYKPTLEESELEFHQLEREGILYLQRYYCLPIKNYNYILEPRDKILVAVKKTFMHDIEECFYSKPISRACFQAKLKVLSNVELGFYASENITN